MNGAPQMISAVFRRLTARAILGAAAAGLVACAGGPGDPGPRGGAGPHVKIGAPYQVNGRWYRPAEDPTYDRTGVASWYGAQFHGRSTANGERFDRRAVSAAHTTLPLPSFVEVENLDNGRRLVVRVNDRGPFKNNRIIDLSQEAARRLGFEAAGLANVRVRYLGPAALPGEAKPRYAATAAPSPAPMAPPPSPGPDAIATLIAEVDEPPSSEPALFAVELAETANLDTLPNMRAALPEAGPLRIRRTPGGGKGAGAAREASVYIVSLGPYTDPNEASLRLAEAKAAGFLDARFVEITP